MIIEYILKAYIAVLGITAFFFPVTSTKHSNQTLFSNRDKTITRKRHTTQDSRFEDSTYKHDIPLQYTGKFFLQRDNSFLMRQELKNVSRNGIECCPAVVEMIEPDGGKNQDDQYVELYRDGSYRQRFYEMSCHIDILGKPCRFMDKRLHERSKCVQKYSYTYALVKDPGLYHHLKPKTTPFFPTNSFGSGTMWTLDYIRIRSGCACVILPNMKRKRDRGKHKKDKINLYAD